MPRMDLLHYLIKIKYVLCQEEQTKRIRGKVKKAQHTLARGIQGRFSNIHRQISYRISLADSRNGTNDGGGGSLHQANKKLLCRRVLQVHRRLFGSNVYSVKLRLAKGWQRGGNDPCYAIQLSGVSSNSHGYKNLLKFKLHRHCSSRLPCE